MFAGNPVPTPGSAFFKPVQKGVVRQLTDHDELAVEDFDALERQDKRVPDLLDLLQGSELLAGLGIGELSIDELDRLEQTARSLGLPDLAKTAGP